MREFALGFGLAWALRGAIRSEGREDALEVQAVFPDMLRREVLVCEGAGSVDGSKEQARQELDDLLFSEIRDGGVVYIRHVSVMRPKARSRRTSMRCHPAPRCKYVSFRDIDPLDMLFVCAFELNYCTRC